MLHDGLRVAYVVKRYPRYSETFIVNEVLAHESAGMQLDIFALRPPIDTHFQDTIARVRAPVSYVPSEDLKAATFWSLLEQTSMTLPGLCAKLPYARHADSRDVYQAMWVARAARERGITHLHAHFGTSATEVARLAAYFAGISYSFTAHAKDIFHESVVAADLQRKLRDAAAVITVSDYNVAYLQNHYNHVTARIERVYNGLDLDTFPFKSPREREPVIISVGRLVEKKGFNDLVDACAILKKWGTQFRCQIIGSGELEADLQAQIQYLGVEDVVELAGPRPQRAVIAAVQGAAVFAAPCVVGSDNNQDGLPTVLLEAMALGTPCVATPVTGIPEAIRHNDTGLLVPQHDPAALAAALQRLLDNAELRVHLATSARQLIEARFNVEHSAARLRAIFAAAAAAPHASEVVV